MNLWYLLAILMAVVGIVESIRSLGDKIEKELLKMKEQLEALQLEVTRNTNLAASAVALIKGLADQISSNANNPEALKTLADHLRENDDLIAAALSANTPVAPAPKQSTTAVVDEATGKQETSPFVDNA